MSACHTYIFVLVSIKRLIFRRKWKKTWVSFFMRNDFFFISSITISHYGIFIFFGCHKIFKIRKMSSIFDLHQFNIFCDLKKIAKKWKFDHIYCVIFLRFKMFSIENDAGYNFCVFSNWWFKKEGIYGISYEGCGDVKKLFICFISSITIWHFIFFSL